MTDEEQVELEPDLAPGMEAEEDTPQTRTIKRSALEQGSTIPLGWKPSVAKPIPVMQCAFIFKDHHPKAGERCGRWSLRGSRLCWIHSGRGNLKHVNEYREALIEGARLQLVEAAPEAVDVLLDLMANSGADAIRLKAATEVLDRNGVKSASESNLNVNVNDVTADPLSTLSERLEKLKSAAAAVDLLKQKAAEEHQRLALEAADPPTAVLETDEDVIDAEVVEESSEPDPD